MSIGTAELVPELRATSGPRSNVHAVSNVCSNVRRRRVPTAAAAVAPVAVAVAAAAVAVAAVVGAIADIIAVGDRYVQSP